MRRRFWYEAITAFAGLVCCTITLLVPAWIETLFRLDPDHGSGAVEWMIIATAAAVAVVASLSAYRELRLAGQG